MNQVAITTKHGENDYSVWMLQIPYDDPILAELLNKYETYGYSVRGTAEEVKGEIEWLYKA